MSNYPILGNLLAGAANSGSGTIDADNISSGVLGLTYGGTGADLSGAPAGSIAYINGNKIVSLPLGLNGQILMYSGGAISWVDVPTQLSDLTDVTSAAQTPNLVLATPDGVGGAYLGRQLVVNDIPDLPASKITSGTLPTARGGTGADLSVKPAGEVLYTDGSGAIDVASTPAEGDLLGVSGGVPTWGSPAPLYGDLLHSDINLTDGSYPNPITFNFPDLSLYKSVFIKIFAKFGTNAWLHLRINNDAANSYRYTYVHAYPDGHVMATEVDSDSIETGFLLISPYAPLLSHIDIYINNLDFVQSNRLWVHSTAINYNGRTTRTSGLYLPSSPTLNSVTFYTVVGGNWKKYALYIYGLY